VGAGETEREGAVLRISKIESAMRLKKCYLHIRRELGAGFEFFMKGLSTIKKLTSIRAGFLPPLSRYSQHFQKALLTFYRRVPFAFSPSLIFWTEIIYTTKLYRSLRTTVGCPEKKRTGSPSDELR